MSYLVKVILLEKPRFFLHSALVFFWDLCECIFKLSFRFGHLFCAKQENWIKDKFPW